MKPRLKKKRVRAFIPTTAYLAASRALRAAQPYLGFSSHRIDEIDETLQMMSNLREIEWLQDRQFDLEKIYLDGVDNAERILEAEKDVQAHQARLKEQEAAELRSLLEEAPLGCSCPPDSPLPYGCDCVEIDRVRL